jgi:hypothetical protein
MQDQLQHAIQLAQAGQRDQARPLLRQVVKSQPHSEAAWLWLAAVAETPAERLEALKTAFLLNPSNQQTRSALQSLGQPLDDLAQAAPIAPDSPPPANPEIERSLGPLGRIRQGKLTPADYAGLILLALVALYVLFVAFGGLGEEAPPPTATPTATFTSQPSLTPSITPTFTLTYTPGPSPTPFIFQTLAPTWTPAPSDTPRPTRTPAPTITPFPSDTPNVTNTPAPSRTPRPSFTPSFTPSATDTPSATPTNTLEPTATPRRTATPEDTDSDPTATRTPRP